MKNLYCYSTRTEEQNGFRVGETIIEKGERNLKTTQRNLFLDSCILSFSRVSLQVRYCEHQDCVLLSLAFLHSQSRYTTQRVYVFSVLKRKVDTSRFLCLLTRSVITCTFFERFLRKILTFCFKISLAVPLLRSKNARCKYVDRNQINRATYIREQI